MLPGVALAIVLVALFAFSPGVAEAATNHVPGLSFDRPDGSAPTSLAVDEANGSVYALSGSTIEKFDAAGNPSNFSATGTNSVEACVGSFFGCTQIAVDNSGGPNQGVLYLADLTPFSFGGAGIRVYLPSGELLAKDIKTMSEAGGNGTSPCGVAVEGDGDLVISYGEWTGNISAAFVDRLDVPDWAAEPEAKPEVVGEYGQDFPYTCRTAVDSRDNVYHLSSFAPETPGPLRRVGPEPFGDPNYAGGGVPESLVRTSEPLDEGSVGDFAIDSGDFLYATHPGQSRVLKYDPTGAVVEVIEESELHEPTAIAVNRSSGTVYVADRSSEPGTKDVRTYEPVDVPDSTTDDFDATSQTSGTLSGTADPAGAGPISSCDFQLVPASEYASTEFETATTVPCDQAPPFSSPTDVSVPVSGLTVEQQYAYRLRATGPDGTSNGTVRRFTPHEVIGLETEDATDVAPRSASLNASFDGNGDQTTYYFEYGKSKVYGTQSAPVSAGEPSGEKSLVLPVSGLDPETNYHYRVVATNSGGTSIGEDVSFRTAPAVAGLATKPVGAISLDSVTLNGEFVGTGLPTSYYFQYGPTRAYGTLSDAPPGLDAGTPSGPTQVSSEIEDFRGYGTYHYRVVAVNELGTTYGKDQMFQTLPAEPPAVRAVTVAEVEPTSAVFGAEVNPRRWTTSYLFEWGTDTTYGFSTSLENTVPGNGNEFQPVELPISGLEPGTRYHFRVVALNISGTTNGPDMTFTTPSKPGVELAGASAVTTTSARLSAVALPWGRATSVRFEYGTSAAYGSVTAPVQVGSGFDAAQAIADLAGLSPQTTYHFRVVAENELGTTVGPDVTFQTLGTGGGGPEVTPPKSTPKKCAKGKVKRKGKCVKKKKRKRHGGKKKGHRQGGKRG